MLTDKGGKTTEQIIAKFCYEEAVSFRIANEYLKILELAGVIKNE